MKMIAQTNLYVKFSKFFKCGYSEMDHSCHLQIISCLMKISREVPCKYPKITVNKSKASILIEVKMSKYSQNKVKKTVAN